MNEDEYIAFLEHKLRKLHFLITTGQGIEQNVREQLHRVLMSDSYFGIETEGN